VVLQGYLARKTILFVGYDLADPHFKRLYRKVTAPFDHYARRAYAFGEAPAPQVCRWCQRHGIDLVEADATALLESLTRQLAARSRPSQGEIQELLRREMESWQGLGKLIEPTALKLIHERSKDLRWLRADQLELLLRSALTAGYEVKYWFERACQGNVAADQIALESLQSYNFRTRAAVVAALGELGDQSAEAIIEMLADDYPQVRVAAIQTLEQLRPDGKWRKHLKYECYVPAGEFIMGDDKGSYDHEKPAHRVYLDAFYIGRYPVTNTDYERYKDDVKQPFEIPRGKADHPVVRISWYDARNYAAWAGMRLLTEAEWEKAARGGLQIPNPKAQTPNAMMENPRPNRKYPWGDEFDQNRCNTNGSDIRDPTPVGKYSPQGDSPYGCADMAGNVWEWTNSLDKGYPYQADDGREDPSPLGDRVLRGSSFVDSEDDARCATRDADGMFNWDDHYGFRVGWSAPLSPASGTTKVLDSTDDTEPAHGGESL
jgi:hypothetical protein